ncbi:o-succinylbenzoate--CoA ligase [Shewanella donghaensis]|uniref:o-succinylbenzoate--CoA ligase n=1 Tax=Shewanella donghaensis TaxID=238836 RepID=UPI001181F3F1|nr:o-succinylbenzoate--CoA ligase [Shewanella donghaensis]
MTQMISPLHQTAIDHPDAVAIVLPNGTAGTSQISYIELSQMILLLAQQLSAQGVVKGHRIASISHNNLEMICLYWACIDLGTLFVPISPRFPAIQVSQLCQRFNINSYWLDQQVASAMEQPLTQQLSAAKLTVNVNTQNNNQAPLRASPVDVRAAVNVILTSGSTGTPKGVVHSLSNHIASAKGSAVNIVLNEGDSWLLSLPLFHIGGLAIVNRCAIAAATLIMSSSKPLTEQLTQTPISHLSLVSAQLSQILNEDPDALQHVKALLLGGGAIDADLVSSLEKLNINAFCSYGMSEMSSQITTAAINTQHHLGTALPQRQLKLIDGVIWVKGPCLFLGYLSDESTSLKLEKTLDNDGWFCTQDQGRLDPQGNLHLLGRVDNMFICGGENIHPEEIEAALRAHPDIAQAIVFPQHDAKFSLLPAAIIQFNTTGSGSGSGSGLSVETITEIETTITTNIARFKRPRHYYAWPDNIESASLKTPRKQIIAAIKAQYNLD